MDSLYSILGLPNFASDEDIKRAFRSLALLYHPDRNPDNVEAEEKFKMLNDAYQILSNPEKKRRYDEILLYGGYRYAYPFNREETTTETPQQERYQRQYAYRETVYQRWKIERGKQEKQSIIWAIGIVAYIFIIVKALFVFYARLEYFNATQAYQEKQYEKALQHLRNSNGTDNEYARAYFLAGQIYMEKFDYNGEAVANFTLGFEYSYQIPTEYYFKRGMAYTYLKEENFAESDFRVVLQREPSYDKHITKILAEAYYMRFRNYDKAIVQYKKYLTYEPKFSEAYQNLGMMYKEKEQYNQAITNFTKFIGFQQDNSEILYERALCYLYTQDIESCCTDWQKVKKLNTTIKDGSLDFFCKQDSVNKSQTVVVR